MCKKKLLFSPKLLTSVFLNHHRSAVVLIRICFLLTITYMVFFPTDYACAYANNLTGNTPGSDVSSTAEEIFTWTGATSSNFDDATNWLDNLAPNSNSGANTILIGPSTNAPQKSTVFDYQYRLEIQEDGVLNLTAPGHFRGRVSSKGTINIGNGVLVTFRSTSHYIGYGGATATFNVTGNSNFNTQNHLNCHVFFGDGVGSHGIVTIDQGGTFQPVRATFGVNGGQATINVMEGGTFSSSVGLTFGDGDGSKAVVNIHDMMSVASLVIGSGNGEATFELIDTLSISGTLTIGDQGKINLNSTGVLKYSGDKVAEVQALIDDGKIVLPGEYSSAVPTFDGSYTYLTLPEEDEVAPTVSISSFENNPTNKSPIGISITFSEEVNGFHASDITVGNGSVTNLFTADSIEFTFDLVPDNEGATTVNIVSGVVTDNAGNTNAAATEYSVTYDSTAPTVEITSSESSPTSTSPIPITITFSEAVTDFSSADILVGNGSMSDLSTADNLTYTAEITPSSDGMVTVNVSAGIATDNAGNGNIAASQFSIDYDTTGPSAVSFTRKTPGNAFTNADELTFLVTFNEDVVAVEQTDFEVIGPTGASISVSSVTNSSYHVTVSGGDLANMNGTVGLDFSSTVNIADNAGNVLPNAEPATDEIYTVDNVPPTVVAFELLDSPGSDADSVTYRVVFSEVMTGVDMSDFYVRNVSGTAGASIVNIDSPTVDNTQVRLQVTGTLTGGGSIRLELSKGNHITDLAGNGGTLTYTATAPEHIVSRSYDPEADHSILLNPEDVPAISPIRLNTGSIGLLIPALSARYGGSQRVHLHLSMEKQINALTFRNSDTLQTDYTATLILDQNSVRAVNYGDSVLFVLSGSMTFTGESYDSANLVKSKLKTLKFGSITVDSTKIGSINAVALAFKLNIASAGLVKAINKNFTHQTYPRFTISKVSTIVADTTALSPIPFTVSYDEFIGELTESDLEITNGTVSTIDEVNDSTYTVNVTPASDGLVVLKSKSPIIAGSESIFTVIDADTTFSDTSRPSVVITSTASSPSNASSIPITITFSERIRSFAEADVEVEAGEIDNLMTSDSIVFTADLIPGFEGEVTLDIEDGVCTDLAGNGNTAASQFGMEYDSTGPEVSLLGPLDDATGVDLETDLVITFNEGVSVGTGTIVIQRNSDGAYLETMSADTSDNVSVSGNTVTINPSNDLPLNTEISIQIPATAFLDAAGNSYSGISNTTDWSFTTTDTISVAINDVTSSEGNTGDKNFTFTVSLSRTASSTINVDYTTLNGSAVAGSDYAIASGTLTFNAGESSKTITVVVSGDEMLEADETFTVSLSNLVGKYAQLSDAIGAGTIMNDDAAAVTIADVSADEGGGDITVTAILDKAVQGGFKVNVSTADGTASASDSDYTAVSGQTLIFTGTVGETQTFTITPVSDTKLEADETLTVVQSNLSGTSLQVDITDGATVTLINDDVSSLTIADVSGDEDSGSITVTISLDNAVPGGFTVDVSTLDGTAAAGSDYTPVSGETLTFAGTAGESKTFSVFFTADEMVEDEEQLSVILSDLSNTPLAVDFSDEAVITIVNDDYVPVITSASLLNTDENSMMVGTITATDADAGTVLTFSLESGEDQALFSINESSGELSFVTRPDFESPADADSDNEYLVRIAASDGTNKIVQNIAVKVNDLNDNAPVIAAASFTVDQKLANGSQVGILVASDADQNTVLQNWTITNGNENSAFALTASSGQLIIADQTQLIDPEILLTVTVSDGVNTSQPATVIVNVQFDTEPDSDGDGLIDALEDVNGDGNIDNDDSDGDGLPNYLDSDDDGDGISTADEDTDGDGDPTNDDADGDGIPDYLDEDGEAGDVPSETFIPQGISPDGNGANDTWTIPGIENYSANKVTIFNRWGQVVYEVTGYDNGDTSFGGFSNQSTVAGKHLPDGSYFYVIDLGNGENRKGYLIIKK